MTNIRRVHKNFGDVQCGVPINRTFEIVNTTQEPQIFVVEPDDELRDSINPFRVEPTQVALEPGMSYKLNVMFLAFVPDVIFSMTYRIVTMTSLAFYITARAKTLGPCVSVLFRKLVFFCTYENPVAIHQLEFVNSSAAEGKFQFDVGECQTLFQFSHVRGVVPANGRFLLKVKFNPMKPGAYYRRIFCLFYFQKPIMIKLIGIFATNEKFSMANAKFNYPGKRSSLGFGGYMERLNRKEAPQSTLSFYQTLKIKGLIPKKSMNREKDDDDDEEDEEKEKEEILQLQHKETEGKNEKDNETLQQDTEAKKKDWKIELHLSAYYINCGKNDTLKKATTLLNLSRSRSYFFEWDDDPEGFFRLEPSKGVIIPEECVNFTVHFDPKTPDLLYHKELTVRIFPYVDNIEGLPPNTIDLPDTLTLNLIGHSFPPDSYGWMAQCRLAPQIVVLPPAIAEEVVYTAFAIEREGHLPVTFRLIPPENSLYVVQPMQGFLSQSYQLVIVQLDARSRPHEITSEKWTIRFNETPRNDETIEFITMVELPRVVVGTSDCYTFETTYPGAQCIAKVPVKNITHLSLFYFFTIPEDITWLEIPRPKGFIEPLARKYVEIIFKPTETQEYLDYIAVTLISCSMKNYFTTMDVRLIGSCEHTILVATPNNYNFGECFYGEPHSTRFLFRNFSPVCLFYELRPVHRAFPTGDPSADVSVTPKSGKMKGKEQIEVEVTIVPHDKEVFQYSVEYRILKSEKVELEGEPSRKIFNFRFEGMLPTFQVIDVNVMNGGPLFSPTWLWKMMDINRFNEVLDRLRPGEHQEVDMILPDAMIDTRTVEIYLLVQASKTGSISWNIKRRVLCDCPVLKEHLSFSLRYHHFDCYHRRSMNIKPLTESLDPEERKSLKISLKYEVVGLSKQEWNIYLPNDRKITLKSMMHILPVDEPSVASLYTKPILLLKPVFIGDMEPSRQLFWLYNNTIHSASYVLDVTALKESFEFADIVFDCFNPHGIIPPFSCLPIIFIFKPIEIIRYTAEVYLCLRVDDPIPFSIQGDGILTREPFKEVRIEKNVPEAAIYELESVPVKLSITTINIKPFPTHSKVLRIFFMENKSQKASWAFQWHLCQLNEIIVAHVEPIRGLLTPGERKTMKLVVESLFFPADISLSLPCDVVNFDQLRRHEGALMNEEVLVEKTKDHFTITEKGMTNDTLHINIPERPILHHIFVSINSTTVSGCNIDQKISLREQLALKSDVAMLVIGNQEQPNLTTNDLLVSRSVLERVLWTALHSLTFKNSFESLKKLEEPVYQQLAPGTAEEDEQMQRYSTVVPSKNFTQRIIENVLLDLVHSGLEATSDSDEVCEKRFRELD